MQRLVLLALSLAIALASSAVPLLGQISVASAHEPTGKPHDHLMAMDPNAGTITVLPPTAPMTKTVTLFSGGPYSVPVLESSACSPATCDYTTMQLTIPGGFWSNHLGGVVIDITANNAASDYDLFVYDSNNSLVGSSASSGGNERIDLGQLAAGTYTIEAVPWLPSPPGDGYTGRVTLTARPLTGGLSYPKVDIAQYLTVDYPLYVVFMGRKPTADEVAKLRANIPTEFRPAIGSVSPGGDEIQNTSAGLVNWQKNHLLTSQPVFMPIKYEYDLHILYACDCYTEDLFAVAEAHTKFDYPNPYQDFLTAYNAEGGELRAARGPQFVVADTTVYDLVDAFAVEDWIFETRHNAEYDCAFTDLETGGCYDPSIIAPDPNAYHDPYYDLNGPNLNRMPQGANPGSTMFIMDTFTPEYSGEYFRPNRYHAWGTRQIENNQFITETIDPYTNQRVAQPDGERVTDPDSGLPDGIDWARTWGGRYRFHFIDVGAMPNDMESETWANRGRSGGSHEYPYGDPPIWEYDNDPRWQGGTDCRGQDGVSGVVIDTECELMPRLARDISYGLFFRMTAAYLYRPTPRADVIWLAVSNFVDYYSRPVFTDPDGIGPLPGAWSAGAPPFEHSPWWTDTTKLNKPNEVLRWLSSSIPYATWIGREGDQFTVQRRSDGSAVTYDFSPRHIDLPAGPFRTVVTPTLGLLNEPTFDASKPYWEVQRALEKGKAEGLSGAAPDGSVSHESFRDFIDSDRDRYAPRFRFIDTIPAINVVFEKVYTWALPAIVGGIAVADTNGEAWGVLQNVNDRYKWSESHRPTGDLTNPNQRQSLTETALPTQETGTGFSYTIEHEAAHNLGLSHPHDGSYGVDKCPEGHPNAGQWKCYWTGLGWMFDSAAAPTTYAMSYRPYEVEDQDTMMRGRTAAYLDDAQNAMINLYADASAAGLTNPTPEMLDRDADMRAWRDIASNLFKVGDYLHAEYAARNAFLATQVYNGARLALGPNDTDPNRIAPRRMVPGETPKPYIITPQTIYPVNEIPLNARADVNRDSKVDVRDIQLVAGAWNTTCDDQPYEIRYDNTGVSSRIETVDILFVASRWQP